MRRKWLKYLLVTVLLLVLGEVLLRTLFDNETRVLYFEDAFCEYRLQPNQDVTRFHNRYQTNEYGMRSGPVKKGDRRRILLFGDSVLNGGSKIDQADIINNLLDEQLMARYGDGIGVHNISAGSWGPENAYRFFENYIDFEFDMMILVFSSEDYHDNMTFRKVVGEQPAWPDSQPYLALTDLYAGFIYPKFVSWFGNEYAYLEGFDDSPVNPGWALFTNYAIQNQKTLIFYHHPVVSELEDKKYSAEGDSLNAMLQLAGVPVVSGLDYESQANFTDRIHITREGNAVIASALMEYIVSHDPLNLEN